MDRKQILDSLKAEMIETLQKVLRFETVTTDALPGMPFGKNNADCLAYVLKKEDLARALFVLRKALEAYPGHVDE